MFVVFISANPIFSIPFMGIAYVWWLNAYFYEASRRAVVRMDILLVPLSDIGKHYVQTTYLTFEDQKLNLLIYTFMTFQ